MTCWHRNRINGRRLGTARPFPLWRLHSGPQSSSVDQYSETPPEHLASSVAEAMRRSVVTRHCLSKKLDAETGRVPHRGCEQNLGGGQRDLPLVGVAPPQRKR